MLIRAKSFDLPRALICQEHSFAKSDRWVYGGYLVSLGNCLSFFSYCHYYKYFLLFFLLIAPVTLPATDTIIQEDEIQAELHILGLRFLDSPEKSLKDGIKKLRILIDFNQKPDYRTMVLSSPARLVLTLPVTQFPIEKEQIEKEQRLGMLQTIRMGMASRESSRIIFTMSSFFKEDSIHLVQFSDSLWQLVIDLVVCSEEEFTKNMQAEKEKRVSPSVAVPFFSTDFAQETPRRSDSFTIVIDAGHGSFDSGAVGTTGVLEKDITLSFAKILRDILQQDPSLNVVMTRDKDVFLRLGERVNFARRYKADLFISIHADHIDNAKLRGATVYTLSHKASDFIAQKLAERENKADLLDGLPPDESLEITNILMDLRRRETNALSVYFAKQVVAKLQQFDSIQLINNPHRFAGFRVLQASDIPSILLELGYLSNKEDEMLISNQQWQEKMAEVIALSLWDYINSDWSGMFNYP